MTTRDPYSVLGVAKTADAAAIKKAFRQLAKKYHPDQSKEHKAKEKFAEVSAAYEIIGDEKKRVAFDRGEIDADGKPRAPNFEGFGGPRGGGPGGPGGPGGSHFEFNFGGGRPGGAGFDPSDLFGDLFGGARRAGPGGGARPKGEDIAANATVSLLEAVNGGKTRVFLPSGRTLEVNIPAGIEEGKQIRLKGQGHPSQMGGESGDVMITVKIAKHAFFQVEGRDLRLDLPLTLYEAVLGGKVNVPTLTGAVEMNIPAGSAGKTLRLRGKGLPATDKLTAGDLYVTLRVVLPEGSDDALNALMQTWQKTKPYDPRKDIKA